MSKDEIAGRDTQRGFCDDRGETGAIDVAHRLHHVVDELADVLVDIRHGHGRLAKEGLVKPLPTEGEGRDVKRYRITPAGRGALRKWLDAPPVAERARNELLLKVFFGASADASAIRCFIEEAGVQAQRRLEALKGAEALVLREDRASGDLAYSLITILSGQHAAAARIAWSQSALKLLDANESGGPAAVLRNFARLRTTMKGE